MADKDFIAEVAKAQVELTPVPGEKLEAMGDGHLSLGAAGGRGQGCGDGETVLANELHSLLSEKPQEEMRLRGTVCEDIFHHLLLVEPSPAIFDAD